MPLYTIKHLKAPWPAGAVVGDVIEFEVLPGWAAGKCELGGTQATVFAEQGTSGDDSGVALAPVDPDAAKIAAAMADAEEQASRERERIMAEQKATIENLIADVKAGLAQSQTLEQQLAAAKADLEASLAREATLQAHLTDAQKLNEAAAGELEKVRGQVEDLQTQLATAKAEPKATKK